MQDKTIGWFTWLYDCCQRKAPYNHYALNFGRIERTTDVIKLTREQYEQVHAYWHTIH